MRVAILHPVPNPGAERARAIAAALSDGGHRVSIRSLSGLGWARPVRGLDVVHACGPGAIVPAALLARLAGAALVHEPLSTPTGAARSGARARIEHRLTRRCSAVLAADQQQAGELRRALGLSHLPPVTGGPPADASRVLLGVYDRLPQVDPERPAGRALAARVRADRLLAAAGESLPRRIPRHPVAIARYLRGRLLRARGHPERAADSFGRAVRGDSNRALYRLQLALSLEASGSPEEAADELAGLVTGRAGSDLAVLGRAGLELARLGREREARGALDGLAELDGRSSDTEPGDAAAWTARVLAALGEMGRARELGLEVTGTHPSRRARRNAALALEQAGEPSLALELARSAGAFEQGRRLAGLLRALDPGWTPLLRRGTRSQAAGGRRILCLLESSLPQAPSGYAYRSNELLAALQIAGFDPVAATRLGFPASRGVADWSPVECVAGIVHHRFNVPGLRQYSGIPLDLRLQRNAESLLLLLERLRPAAIIAGTPQLNGVMALALRSAAGVPVIYDVRGFPEMTWAASAGGSESELYGRRRLAETRCAVEADAVITLSPTMRDELVVRGVEPSRIALVPQIVDTERYAPRPRNDALAGALGVQGRFVVGSVSSLVAYEGLDVLLRAVAAARRGLPGLTALIVGDGPARPSLEALADELDLCGAAVFAGRVERDRIPDYYALLDLCVLPRRNLEVCRAVTPLKPFEVLAAGIPLLASDLPALAAPVLASGGGRLVPSESPTELAEAILELAGDPAARRVLSASGRAYAIENHSRALAARSLTSAIDAALERSGG